MQNPNQYPQDNYSMGMNPMNYMPTLGGVEENITNIVAQIDPKTIIDNLDHALKGEHWNKEKGEWEMNASGKPMVNNECRGAIISYLDGILTNNTTMANLDEKRLSYLMESIISSIKRMFIVNLEKFGFVPEGERFKEGEFYNKGTPDSARMTMVANMVFKVCYLVFSRALGGEESKRIFKSLRMSDPMSFGMMPDQNKKQGWLSSLFSR